MGKSTQRAVSDARDLVQSGKLEAASDRAMIARTRRYIAEIAEQVARTFDTIKASEYRLERLAKRRDPE